MLWPEISLVLSCPVLLAKKSKEKRLGGERRRKEEKKKRGEKVPDITWNITHTFFIRR